MGGAVEAVWARWANRGDYKSTPGRRSRTFSRSPSAQPATDMDTRGPWLLAMLLLPGLCALASAEKPAACRCSRLEPKNRKNCGFPGITSEQCFEGGCCFDSSVVGVPWCFHPLPAQDSEQCVMEVSARKNCGYPGISSELCAARNCCFSNTTPQVPWCFFPQSVEDCHY
ncbi:trefoil factor 2 [Oryctolagus cuniculus]|uniref:trefoil factor 2 n=1 Tax=Oryctolagus cuniculus TaxID=9986 RepID=UPI00387A0EF1